LAHQDQTTERPLSLSRRAFTLDAALALLAGCVIIVSDACGSSSSPAAPSAPSADVTGTVSANHGHTAVITGAQITAAQTITLSIQGTSAHSHTLSITQAELNTLKNRQAVAKDSSTDNNHLHSITFTPA